MKVIVPKRMSINSGDMGVIYGNLIDNAIEACTRVPDGKRFVDIETKYQDGKLLIMVCNSKDMESNPTFVTTKENKRKHGRGTKCEKSCRTVRRESFVRGEGGTFKASLLPYKCGVSGVKSATYYS